MKKALKILFVIVMIIITAGVGGCFLFSKKVPEGIQSEKTALMIDKMNEALDKPAWDSTRYFKWTFMGNHHYIWDKEANLAQIKWGDKTVLLDPDEVTGVAYAQNQKLSGKEEEKAVSKAWSFWCNDMFWMTAPFKVNDPGVSHELVEGEDGDRLKVIYNSGGVTPGDIYVWSFDAEGKPKSYEMYVGILPIKGINVPWNGWKKISTGAMVSTSHDIKGMGLLLENVKGGMTLADIDLTEDIWAEIR